jgi:hypothetical protein
VEEGHALKIAVGFAVEHSEHIFELLSVGLEVIAGKLVTLVVRKVINHLCTLFTSVLNHSLYELDEYSLVSFV